jgi:flagellar basal-body rod protein FlgB
LSSPLFDKTTNVLGSSINFRSLRQNVTSANIANAETPGFKAKVVDFEEALNRAADSEGFSKETGSTDPDHYIIGGPGAVSKARADVYDNPDVNVANDGNTVDMEKELATLQENSILYKAALNLINKKLGALKYAATDGAR